MIYVKNNTFTPPECDDEEILRYARCKDADAAVLKLLCECKEQVKNSLSFNLCYTESPVQVSGDICDFGFAKVKSHSLSQRLEKCSNAVFFAATLGLELDRIIKKHTALSPSKAVMLHAIGNERIEALCDLFCENLKAEKASEGKTVTERFSAGYGDLPLEFQRQIFDLLCPQKHIGITLNDSLLMSPSKSVTAIIGIAP